MNQVVAERILAAYPGRKMNVAEARDVVEAWAEQWPRDRWGNFKIHDTRRIKLTKRQAQRQVKDGGRWRNLSSQPLISAALNLVKKAAETLGDESVAAAMEGAKATRRRAAAKRSESAEEERRQEEIDTLALKILSAELPVEFAAAHDAEFYWRDADPDLRQRLAELKRQLRALRDRGQLPTDQQLFDRQRPPLAPLLDDVRAEWTEEIRGEMYTVSIRHARKNEAVIEIGSTASDMSLGMRVDPITRSMIMEPGEHRVGDAYIAGRIQRSERGAAGALFLIISRVKQRGAGGRVLDIWCDLMGAYGTDVFVAEGVGDEGEAFLDAKVRAGRLSFEGRSGRDMVFRCTGGPEARQTALEFNPKIVSLDPPMQAAANPAQILGFPKAPERVSVGSRSYALSDIGVPIVASWQDEASEDDEDEDKARVIDAGGNPFRYIWVYEPSADALEMYRYSDGEWKVGGSPADYPQTFAQLKERRQLNQVTAEEMAEFEAEMRERNRRTIESLQQWWEEEMSDEQRVVNALAKRYLDERVRPEIDRAVADVKRGAIPFEFEYREQLPYSREEQARSHAVAAVLRRHGFFSPYGSPLEEWVLSEMGMQTIDDLQDPQSLQWVVHDLAQTVYR